MASTVNAPSLRERVWRLLAGRERAATVVGTRTVVTPAPAPPASAPGARLSLVGLADVRERLGDRWQELSDRVHELAEVVIRRHLMRGDVFEAHGDDGYMVLFAQLSPAEAEFKCRVIAKEIAAKLLGADLAASSTVAGAVFEVDRAALDKPDFARAISEAVAGGTPVIEVGGPRASTPAPTDTPRQPPASDFMRSFSRIAPPTPDAFSPVWNFDVGALLHFRANAGPSCYAVESTSPMAAAKADFMALAKLLFEVGRLADAGRRLPVICPVSLSTIGNDVLRGQLVRILRQAPPAIRKLVILEIVAPRRPGRSGRRPSRRTPATCRPPAP